MTGALANFSDALAATVAEAEHAVVRVEARPRLHASGIVWSANGVVVTAHHVVEQEEGIRVGLSGGRFVPAALVGRDPTTDLAVLRAEASGVAPAAWATPDTLKVGHLVLALGRPGESVRATLGIVSALGDSWMAPTGARLDRYLQTDVVMYPGFSGGPLVDAGGRVAGLNTSALLRGIALTVPYFTVGRVVEALLAHGKVRRGYLGISAQPVRLPAALAAQLGQETGLLVAAVSSASPAERAGVLLGDVVVSLGGQPIRAIDELLSVLNSAQIGASVSLRIVRGGQVRELSVIVGEQS